MPKISASAGERGAASGIAVREWRSSTRISPRRNVMRRFSKSRWTSTSFRNFDSGRNVSSQRAWKASAETGSRKTSTSRGPEGTPSSKAMRQPRRGLLDRERAQARLDPPPPRGDERRKRKADVADPLVSAGRLDEERGVVEVVEHAAEREAGAEAEIVQERCERRYPREARAPGPRRQAVGPEHVRGSGAGRAVRDPREAEDLRGGLERDAIVETEEEPLEITRAGAPRAEIEVLEDLVGGNRQRPRSFSTRPAMRSRAAGSNQ